MGNPMTEAWETCDTAALKDMIDGRITGAVVTNNLDGEPEVRIVIERDGRQQTWSLRSALGDELELKVEDV